MDELIQLLPLMVAAGLFVWLIRWMEHTVQQDPVKTRAHAVSIGLTIQEVERVRPIFDAQEGLCMRRLKTTCYCVERTHRSSLYWELLQRPPRQDDKHGFPKGWDLVIRKGVMPASLRDALFKIAKEWKDEYLEFEGNPDWVIAYWEEHGGKMRVEQIARYLKEIEAASRPGEQATGNAVAA